MSKFIKLSMVINNSAKSTFWNTYICFLLFVINGKKSKCIEWMEYDWAVPYHCCIFDFQLLNEGQKLNEVLWYIIVGRDGGGTWLCLGPLIMCDGDMPPGPRILHQSMRSSRDRNIPWPQIIITTVSEDYKSCHSWALRKEDPGRRPNTKERWVG